MGWIWIKEFRGGLDTRRMHEATASSVLVKAHNGHVTRGGEFEKRFAFVSEFSLPPETRGLFYDRFGLVVFGSAPPPVLPTGVSYQRLQHPSGSLALSRVLSVDMFQRLPYVVGEFADGSVHHFYDGVRVEDWFDGRARASFDVSGGTEATSVDDIKVAGVSIISAPVSWQGDLTATAQAIAVAVNEHTSLPDYHASTFGARVNVVVDTSEVGVAPNGRVVEFSVSGDLVINPSTGLVLSGGVDNEVVFQPGRFVKMIGSKMYSTAESLFHFSGIRRPDSWTTDIVGAGVIDMSLELSGSERLIAFDRYQGFIAIFSERVVQIWYVDPDPSLNRFVQSLHNTGTASARSVTAFGDNDIFYLDESGLRSLHARDSSNAAATTDIGVPVDDPITRKLISLSAIEREKVIGLVEPRTGRFWLVMKDEIFVFSYFRSAQISAWSTYGTVDNGGNSFEVDDVVVHNRRVYLRSGDTIYCYGGVETGEQTDSTVAEVWLPYLDADMPTKAKSWTGVDAALSGEWSVSAAAQPTDLAVEDVPLVLASTTYNTGRIPIHHTSSHLSVRFRSRGDGRARLGSVVVHYGGNDDQD